MCCKFWRIYFEKKEKPSLPERERRAFICNAHDVLECINICRRIGFLLIETGYRIGLLAVSIAGRAACLTLLRVD